MSGLVHIVGAGLSGLSAAVHLTRAGIPVRLWEGAGQAGGRARSYFDEALGCQIDNGNHLLLSGNRAAMEYLALIGASESLAGPDEAAFPFFDLRDGARWTLKLGPGAFPSWIFDDARRVPGTEARDYARALKLLVARADATVAQVFGPSGALYEKFWEPMAVSVLNTPADKASARLLLPVLLETFARGEAACRPRIAREGLSESLVTPALHWLAARGVGIDYGHRLTALAFEGARAAALVFSGGRETLGAGDGVILALPPWAAGEIVPGLAVPRESYPIVNVHYRLPRAVNDGTPALLGLVGGTAHWLFTRGAIASVTVSAAQDLARQDAQTIAAGIWREVALALGLAGAPMPAVRVVKERRATFAQDPASLRLRPPARTRYANLLLAGDWTDTGLPATLEGAIRSGARAAALAARSRGLRGAGASLQRPQDDARAPGALGAQGGKTS